MIEIPPWDLEKHQWFKIGSRSIKKLIILFLHCSHMLEKMFRIAWSSQLTSGHGEYCLTKNMANAWILYLKESHPDICHWIEEEPYVLY
jgi:hypothetical protein